MMIPNDYLVGGLDHFLFFHFIWDNPSHWLSYFSRWLKPPTSYCFSEGDEKPSTSLTFSEKRRENTIHPIRVNEFGTHLRKRPCQRRNSLRGCSSRAFMDFPWNPAVSSASTSSFVPFCAHSTIKISSYLRGPLSLPMSSCLEPRLAARYLWCLLQELQLIWFIESICDFFGFPWVNLPFFSAQMTANHRKTMRKP